MKRKRLEGIEFGKRLRSLRTQRNLTVAEIAGCTNVSLSTYREWEQGRAITGLPYLQLATVFRISLNELFGIEKNSRPEAYNRLDAAINLLDELRQYL